MIDGGTAAAIGGVVAMAISGYGSMAAKRAQRAGEQAVTNTQNTSNGFAGKVTGDLTAIRAHLAAQDTLMVAQTESLRELGKQVAKHAAILESQSDDGK